MDDATKQKMAVADLKRAIAQLDFNIASAERDIIHMDAQREDKLYSIEQWKGEINKTKIALAQLEKVPA